MDPRIEILFKDYDTLRAEILARIASAFGLWSVAGGAVAVWAATQSSGWSSRCAAVIAIFILGSLWAFNECATRRCARRVAQIEDQINGLSGHELLQWETHFDAARNRKRQRTS